ncbi:hypothetical protein GCM10010994_09450 [Chelatococcus reniformis]|uniref:Uncharacterized protein n=1 Tax=Chelatococcus reniformis TaxID=1494448 RepID=A0A916TYE6_9HYPH|nr:hypothetical protein GCM10010994_09450 [Chelatococcus reniformis]
MAGLPAKWAVMVANLANVALNHDAWVKERSLMAAACMDVPPVSPQPNAVPLQRFRSPHPERWREARADGAWLPAETLDASVAGGACVTM